MPTRDRPSRQGRELCWPLRPPCLSRAGTLAAGRRGCAIIQGSPDEIYRHHFDDLLRTEKHILSGGGGALARAMEDPQTPENAFLTNADASFQW